jgi:hypothetical protein
MQEGMIETKNGKIWFAAYGEGLKKTPILVLHGGPGFLSMSDGLESLWEERYIIPASMGRLPSMAKIKI